MKYIGIDYGDKKVGIAISDTEGKMAFSRCVLPNEGNLVEDIALIIESESIEGVVVGESRGFDGRENPIMIRIHPFKERLEERTGIEAKFESELFSSQAARRGQEHVRIVDDGAATIILQSYLDRLDRENAATQ